MRTFIFLSLVFLSLSQILTARADTGSLFKSCTGDAVNGTAGVTAQVNTLDMGVFQICVQTPSGDHYDSASCTAVPLFSTNAIYEIDCQGQWNAQGPSARVRLTSADGILNELMVTLPGQAQDAFIDCR